MPDDIKPYWWLVTSWIEYESKKEVDYLWCHIDLHFTDNIKQASIYVSSQSKTLFEYLLIQVSNYFLVVARLNLQKNWLTLMFLIFVFLLIIQSFAYIVTFPFFFCLESEFLLWLIICHFFAIFFPSLYSSGALHLSKARSSLFITFPFIYHLTFTKMAMEINFLYPSFSPELIMRSVMPPPYPIFHQILLFQKNSRD